MTDFITALQSHAEERRAAILRNQWEYRQAAWNIEEHWETFKASLTGTQRQQLDRILSEEITIQHFEDEATFQAALSIGIDLGRL